MAYKTGPMIGLDMVRKYMLPRYEQLNQVIRDCGCDIFFIDPDGNVDLLIPLWLEAGINFFWPLECGAGMDPLELPRKYGKDIILGGGLDKSQLDDKASLKEEVLRSPNWQRRGPTSPVG